MQGLHTRALSRQLLFSNLSFSHLSEMLFCRHMKTMHPDEVTDARSAVEATAVTPNVAAGDVLLFDSWAIHRVRTAFAQDSLRTAVRTAFAQPCAQPCAQPSHSLRTAQVLPMLAVLRLPSHVLCLNIGAGS